MSKQIQDAYIVAATRTPVGKAPKGVFRNTRPDDMLAHVLKAVIAQAPGIDTNRIDDAIIGCAMPEGEQGMNVARIGLLLAGLPDTIAAQTINRFCSSGLQAVALAANEIRLGNADLMLAGGTESMSMVPMMGNKVALSPSVFKDDHVAIAYGMGITAEKVAEEWKVSREEQDAFALASHQKALAAQKAGEFRDEISALEVVSRQADLAGNAVRVKQLLVEHDEGPRPDTSSEGLAKLRPVFRNGQFGGTVTAGNSSQMSDGAGAVLLAVHLPALWAAVGAPQVHAYASVVWTMAGFHAVHVIVAMLIGGFVALRIHCGHVDAVRCLESRIAAGFWRYVVGLGAVTWAVLHLFPRWL